jgi:beta-glucanase (GH16 family)
MAAMGLLMIFVAFAPQAQAAPPAGYAQSFADEFDGTLSLDPACNSGGTWATHWCAWNTRRLYDNSDDGVKMHNEWKGINGGAKTIQQVLSEAKWPNPSLHEVSNGTLKMRTYPIPAAYQAQFDWYGAKPPSAASMISTEKSFGQKYGYWEVRAKLNSTPRNNHYSLWLLTVRPAWPPEIDLLETVVDKNNASAGILSSANSHGENPALDITFFKPDGGMLGVWHTYGFLWTATTMTWYVDGKVVRTHANYINEPMYFLGSWEVGGNWVGEINSSTPWPQEIEIDYVRVYQQANGPAASVSSVPAPQCTLIFPSGSLAHTGFGTSWSHFTSDQSLLLDASCTAGDVTIRAGASGLPTYVYKQGYKWAQGNWQPYAFSGSSPAGEWFAGSATARVAREKDYTLFVAYTCQYVNGAWKCGCADSICGAPKWQLQGAQG